MREKSGNGSVDAAGKRSPVRMAPIVLSVSAAFALLLSIAGPASAERPFTPRFSQNVQGAITFTANTVMTCPNSDARCPGARAGTGSTLNNNSFNMTYVDIDSDATTFNSSAADLTVPAGAQVLFAGLYYDGQTTAGVGGSAAPSPSSRGTVRFRRPGDSGYQTLSASVDDSTTGKYAAFVDVTDRVATAGSGTYTVANVQAGTGEDRGGGWALVVAFRDTAEPARNLTIFDGLETVSQGTVKTIGVSGFQTPVSGPVQTDLGFVTYEGDRGSTGDSATLNGTVLSSATNPPNNFFNSSISRDGVRLTDKDPDYDNQLGFDAVQVNADGVLPNGATSATIRLQTNRDQYVPHVVTFATEIFSPTVTATKEVFNLTSPGNRPSAGHVLRYVVAYTNSGGDGATQFTAEDAIPVGTTYLPGSLRITAGPDSPASLSDAIADDRAEYLPDSNSVRFRVGQGANATAGGLLTAAGGPAPAATISFDVTVDSNVTSDQPILNTATGSFLSQTLGTDQSVSSNEVSLQARAPDLVMSKDHADPPPGGPVTFTLGVENGGSGPSYGDVTVVDSFPSAAFSGITITSSADWDCSATVGLNLSCTRSDSLGDGAAYPPIVVEAALVGSPPATFENIAEVDGGGDPNPVNNVAIDYLPAPPATSDLAVTKRVDQATVATGGRVTWTIVVRNNGPSPATGVSLTDSLPAGADSGVEVSTEQGTCEVTVTPVVECEIGSLAAGASVDVTISAVVTADDETGINNTASVEGDQPDTRPNNNEASASFDAAATADLSITKVAAPDPLAGESFTYTLIATNDGPSPANDLVVIDEIPALFTPTSINAPGFTCSALPAAGGTLACQLTGLLAPGDSVTIGLTGDLAGASAGVAVINTASVSSAAGDPDQSDNSSSVTVIPLPFANLSVGKVASRDTVQPGQTFEYRLVVSNAGPVDAEPVTLVDELPSGLDLLEWPDECSLAGRTLTCDLGTVGVEETRSLTLTTRARASRAGSELLNTVTVSAPQPDPFPESAVDRWVTRVGTAKVSPGLLQKVKKPKVRSGRNDRLEIVVRNRSSRAITNARVCQRVPRRLVVIRARTENLASRSRSRVCWTIAVLEPGASKTYWTTVRAISRRPVTVPVRAELSGGNATDLTDSGKVRIIPSKGRTPLPPTG